MKKIGIVSIVLLCLGTLASAQASQPSSQNSSKQNAKSREMATGQASGKAPLKLTSAQPQIVDNQKLTPAQSPPSGSETQSQNRDMAGNHKDGWNATVDKTRGNSGGKGALVSPNGRIDPDDSWNVTMGQSKSNVTAADLDGDGKLDRKKSGSESRVAAGDVNGDGKADAAINNSHSNIKNLRENATGQASGKLPESNKQSEAPKK